MPGLIFAQTDGAGDGSHLVAILLVCLFLFFACRVVMLWYWKVYDIIDNQKAQIREQQATNALLKQLVDKLNKPGNE